MLIGAWLADQIVGSTGLAAATDTVNAYVLAFGRRRSCTVAFAWFNTKRC
jgi:hypothetical protein